MVGQLLPQHPDDRAHAVARASSAWGASRLREAPHTGTIGTEKSSSELFGTAHSAAARIASRRWAAAWKGCGPQTHDRQHAHPPPDTGGNPGRGSRRRCLRSFAKRLERIRGLVGVIGHLGIDDRADQDSNSRLLPRRRPKPELPNADSAAHPRAETVLIRPWRWARVHDLMPLPGRHR